MSDLQEFSVRFAFVGSTGHLNARRAMKQYEDLGFLNQGIEASGEWLAGEFPVLLNEREVSKIGDTLIHICIEPADEFKRAKYQSLAPTADSVITIICTMEGVPV